MLDQLENAGRLPDELLADTLYTGDENVQAAAARGVDLVGPVPGRAGGRPRDADGRRLRPRRADWHNRRLPRGPPADVVSHDTATATTRVEMPESAWRSARSGGNVRSSKHVMASSFWNSRTRSAGWRGGVWKRRPTCSRSGTAAMGIESTNSGLKNRLDLGRLSVRGLKGVSRVVLHKLAGWNVLRASASQKLKSWVASRVAETLGRGACGGPGGFFHRWGRLVGRPVRVFCRVVPPDQRSERLLAA